MNKRCCVWSSALNLKNVKVAYCKTGNTEKYFKVYISSNHEFLLFDLLWPVNIPLEASCYLFDKCKKKNKMVDFVRNLGLSCLHLLC